MPITNIQTPILHINTHCLQNNYTTYTSLCDETTTVSAVVKANAYGCGVAPICKALYEAGCRNFWVATVGEGIDLRLKFDDISIMVLEGIFAPDVYIQHNLIGVINNETQFIHAQDVPCWVHIDTAMNRLGIPYETATKHILQYADKQIVGYMTHLVEAEETESDSNPMQLQRFKDATQKLPNKPMSLCNSDGVFLGKEYHFDMVRVGIGLYGVNAHAHKLSPVVKCSAPILDIRAISPQDTVGYNKTFTADKHMTVATIGIGYADGISLQQSNTGLVYYKDTPCDIIGRVSMDTICIDVSHIPSPYIGDMVSLFHDAKTVAYITQQTQVPPHAVFCPLGERVKRMYTDGTKHKH